MCVIFCFVPSWCALCCALRVVDEKRVRKREESWKHSLSHFISSHSVFCHILMFCFGENMTENLRKLHWGVDEDCSVVLEC